MFGKSVMTDVQSPKMTCLLQFVDEIWALVGPIMSLQNLLILHWVLQFRPSPNLESLVWRNWDIKMPIPQPQIAIRSSFLASGCFCDCPFHTSHPSHNFTNSSFCDITLYYSILHVSSFQSSLIGLPNLAGNRVSPIKANVQSKTIPIVT